MMVKVCGITNREDALAAAKAGATALGFNFYPPSPRCIAPELAAELGEGLSILKVGIFVNEGPADVSDKMRRAMLDVAQVYGEFQYGSLRTWRACRVRSSDFQLPNDEDAEAFLLDGFSPDVYGGAGAMFPWSIARSFQKKIVLAGGLDAGNVRTAIEQARPWGVDACSRIEREPGRKDHIKMRSFIEAALAARL